jgi:hypothetical protein
VPQAAGPRCYQGECRCCRVIASPPALNPSRPVRRFAAPWRDGVAGMSRIRDLGLPWHQLSCEASPARAEGADLLSAHARRPEPRRRRSRVRTGSQKGSQRRPTLTGTCAGQRPTERHQATPGNRRIMTGVKGSRVQIPPSRHRRPDTAVPTGRRPEGFGRRLGGSKREQKLLRPGSVLRRDGLALLPVGARLGRGGLR